MQHIRASGKIYIHKDEVKKFFKGEYNEERK